jgi:hypothetical protein
MVIYSDNLIPRQFGGITLGPVIIIRPQYRGDHGLHVHEREHVRQWWSLAVPCWLLALPFAAIGDFHTAFGLVLLGLAAHGGLYLLSRDYRLWAEVEAHRAHVASGALGLAEAARRISNDYRLHIHQEDALAMLVGDKS